MKVVLVVQQLPDYATKVAGTPVSVERLAKGLHELGTDVTVVTAVPPKNNYPFPVAVLPPVFSGKLDQWGRFFGYTLSLAIRPLPSGDVYHFHSNDGLQSFTGRRPWVRTMHGSTWREIQHTPSWPRKAMLCFNLLQDWAAARLADRVLCVGKEALSIYSGDALADNAFSDEDFHPGNKTPEPSIFYIGWWKGRKRGALAAEIFLREILPQFPAAKLHMVCDHVPDHPSIIAHRGLSNSDLGRLLRSCWVFFNTSAYEGFGMAYVEAMASGVPIVTSRNTGAQYVLQHGRLGIIADDGELGAEVNALLASPGKRDDLARAGLAAAAKFTLREVAQAHLKVYEDLVRSANSSRARR